MNTNVITQDDLNYLAQQSTGRMNMILSGMTSLMNDTDAKVEVMESQTWFQRMIKTVTGKNKITKQEIERNNDRLNAYMAEAITELYNRNCIDHEIIISLGIQLNQIYAEHLQLKQMLGAFVNKLNEKIESVDNFHMLKAEIDQAVYSSESSIIALCKIFAQFDRRIIEDNRKTEIIRRSLEQQNILNDESLMITNYLMDIAEIPVEKIGAIYMELGTIRGNFIADVFLRMIENYHFLPDMKRKLKSKVAVVQETIAREGLDETVTLSMNEIYSEFYESKLNAESLLCIVDDCEEEEIDSSVVNEKLDEATRLFCERRFNLAFELFKELAENNNGRAMYFLTMIYKNGFGNVKEDAELAKMWRIKGKDNGDILAKLICEQKLPVDSIEREQNIYNIAPEVLKLAEEGDVLAQYEVSWLYRRGDGFVKDVVQAFKWTQKAAEGGFWHSMRTLGLMYRDGIGTEQNDDLYFYWCNKAATLGMAEAIDDVGYCYEIGQGTIKDVYKAFEYYNKAAELGSIWGMYHLGKCYFLKKGVSEDNYKAFYWLKKAAEAGHVNAMYEISSNYTFGWGCNKSYEEGFKWLKCAAEHGHLDAMLEVGHAYSSGIGVSKNLQKAKEWYLKAEASGHTHARVWMERLESNT